MGVRFVIASRLAYAHLLHLDNCSLQTFGHFQTQIYIECIIFTIELLDNGNENEDPVQDTKTGKHNN